MSYFVIIILAVMIIIPLLLIRFISLSLIIEALVAKIAVTPFDIISMRFRGSDPDPIVHAAIAIHKGGVVLKEENNFNLIHALESHQLASGDPQKVAEGLIAAQKSEVTIRFADACKIDHNGGNIIRVVAALKEARNREASLDIKKAIEIELALSQKEAE